MKLDVVGRVTGCALVIIAYFVVLHVSTTVGACIQLVGDTISVPYFVRTKSWDVVVMLAFLLCISVSKLVLP